MRLISVELSAMTADRERHKFDVRRPRFEKPSGFIVESSSIRSWREPAGIISWAISA
jgi:hypothetical protein